MAQELATSVELLAVAIQAIPLDRLGQSDAKQLAIDIENRSKSCDKSDVTSNGRSDRRLSGCAAGICAGLSRPLPIGMRRPGVGAAGNRLGSALLLIGFRPRRADAPPCGPIFMILTLAVLIRSFHRFCPVGLHPRNRVLLAM